MESKTKHRLLGMSICVGLFIILLMFFRSEPGIRQEASDIKAPPFPELSASQAIEEIPEESLSLSLNDQAVNAEPGQFNKAILNEEAPKLDKPKGDALVLKDEPKAESQVDDLRRAIRPSIIRAETATQEAATPSSTPITEKNSTPHKKQIKHTKHTVPAIKNNQRTPVFHASIEDNGLFKLQQAAWVIQIGSFKNKTNAVKLANQLRAKGFKAFIQQVSTTIGDSTRVFVGPETKHASARAVAGQLENEMHLRGIVISYKPLAL